MVDNARAAGAAWSISSTTTSPSSGWRSGTQRRLLRGHPRRHRQRREPIVLRDNLIHNTRRRERASTSLRRDVSDCWQRRQRHTGDPARDLDRLHSGRRGIRDLQQHDLFHGLNYGIYFTGPATGAHDGAAQQHRARQRHRGASNTRAPDRPAPRPGATPTDSRTPRPRSAGIDNAPCPARRVVALRQLTDSRRRGPPHPEPRAGPSTPAPTCRAIFARDIDGQVRPRARPGTSGRTSRRLHGGEAGVVRGAAGSTLRFCWSGRRRRSWTIWGSTCTGACRRTGRGRA